MCKDYSLMKPLKIPKLKWKSHKYYSIENIYTNIANTPGFEASKLGELFRTKGVSNIDSFFVEVVPEELVPDKQEELKAAYQMQQRLELMRSNRKTIRRGKGSRENKVELVHG